jgi:hypothetical protein
MMQRIKYNKNLIITNLDQLAHGTGCKYLEVLPDNIHGVLIAVQWKRKPPKQYDKQFALVEF